VKIGTLRESVPVTGFTPNFSPIPRIAPPPFGTDTDGIREELWRGLASLLFPPLASLEFFILLAITIPFIKYIAYSLKTFEAMFIFNRIFISGHTHFLKIQKCFELISSRKLIKEVHSTLLTPSNCV
jgi:hypothetical protein